MARGPDRVSHADPLSERDGLSGPERDFTDGLERIIDRALERHPRGDRFVYGIHQALSPAMIEALVRRYREAGWRDATIREGATGAYLLVLHP